MIDKKRRKYIIIPIIFGLLLCFGICYACEPCDKVLSLEETIEQADLIAVGKKYGEGPLSGPENQPDIYGPSWISVDIDHVLKGKLDKDRIKVVSWSGMCGYGVIIEDENPYLLFIEEGEAMYDSVHWGCSVTKLPVMEGGVVADGTRYSIDEFAQKFGLKLTDSTSAKKVQPIVQKSKRTDLWLKNVLAILIFVALFVALGITTLKWKKSMNNKSK